MKTLLLTAVLSLNISAEVSWTNDWTNSASTVIITNSRTELESYRDAAEYYKERYEEATKRLSAVHEILSRREVVTNRILGDYSGPDRTNYIVGNVIVEYQVPTEEVKASWFAQVITFLGVIIVDMFGVIIGVITLNKLLGWLTSK